MNFFEAVKSLSDDSYDVRESSASYLIKMYPLSRGAILIGCQSADPEIRNRCIEIDKKGAYSLFGKQGKVFLGMRKRVDQEDRIKWLWKVQPEFVNFGMVDFCLEDKTDKRMEALYLLLCPFEKGNELPYLPKPIYDKYSKDKELMNALCDLVNDSWQNKNNRKIIIFNDWDERTISYALNGISNARMWIRGVKLDYRGGGTENIKKQWDKIRDGNYKYFEWDVK